MANLVIVGAQWGDEGKGKVVDLLAPRADVVVRYQGGANAGHTLMVGGRKIVLHLVPSGVMRQETLCIIGNGVVVDPLALWDEISGIRSYGLLPRLEQLRISDRAHLVLATHPKVDRAREMRRGATAIGTTGRGIGPAYEDKVGRRGLRFCDLYHEPTLTAQVESMVEAANSDLALAGEKDGLDSASLLMALREVARHLAPCVADTGALLDAYLRAGKTVLFEGAQGTLLDVDHGTYPYVTSSTTTAAGAALGSGIGPRWLHGILGISKAYSTRVGSGPFVTEVGGPLGDLLRAEGAEYGATTGRPRRCGWLDLPALRYAAAVNGMTSLAITKLDVLSALDEIPVCTSYLHAGQKVEGMPALAHVLDECVPAYTVLPGWKVSLRGARSWEDLPSTARSYLQYIQEAVGVPVSLVSVGPEREEVIHLADPFAPSNTRAEV